MNTSISFLAEGTKRWAAVSKKGEKKNISNIKWMYTSQNDKKMIFLKWIGLNFNFICIVMAFLPPQLIWYLIQFNQLWIITCNVIRFQSLVAIFFLLLFWIYWWMLPLLPLSVQLPLMLVFKCEASNCSSDWCAQ